MTEDQVRAIIREEIARAAPVIMSRTAMAIRDGMRRIDLGYRRYEQQGDKAVDVTFAP